MIKEIFESERLLFKPFSSLTEQEKETVAKSWSNPFNARYNAMKDAKGSVEELSKSAEPTFQDLDNYNDCMHFRVAFDKTTGEIIGTCRFGKYHRSKTNNCWDFGFNVLLSQWYKGYGVEIIGKMLELARSEGVKTFVGGADMENYGSYKAMIKNGFDFVGYDEDGDYRYIADLSKPAKTKAEIDEIWANHLEMTKKDLGIDKFTRLEAINLKIAEMVKRIQSGENEDELVKVYFKDLNENEEFRFG